MVNPRCFGLLFRFSPALATIGQITMRKTLGVLVAVAMLIPTLCFGWGRDGHRIIATVAENHLDETTKVMIQSLIGNNHLYSIANWADEIRDQQRDTAPWHYVNIPLGSRYDANRDCSAPKSCVVQKIGEFLKALTDKQASREQRAEALKFVIHFVGDIHQPMHAVKEATGGNGIHVRFLANDRCGRYECNLHGVWDTSMILQTGLNREDYAERLEELITAEHLEGLHAGTPEQWANESARLAKAAWVHKASGFRIESQEDFNAIPGSDWDAFIRANTSFSNWKEMLQATAAAWTKKQLGF